MLAGSRQKLSGRMSANTGVAPAISIVSAEAKNVNGVVMTSSPGPTPSARSDRYRESVPLATPMACFTPTYSASSFSNACVFGPRTKLPRLPVSRMAASHPFQAACIAWSGRGTAPASAGLRRALGNLLLHKQSDAQRLQPDAPVHERRRAGTHRAHEIFSSVSSGGRGVMSRISVAIFGHLPPSPSGTASVTSSFWFT